MAFLFQRYNKMWYIGYYQPEYVNGIKILKRINISTKTKSKMKANEVMQHFISDRNSLNKPKLIKCSAFISEYLSITCSQYASKHRNNIRQMFSFLIDILDDRYIHLYDTADFDKIIQMKLKTASAYTAKNYRAAYRAAFNQAFKWKYIKANPVIDTKAVDVPEPDIVCYSPAELSRLLSFSSPVIKDIVLFTLYTGLRAGDVVNIRLSDIDFQKRIVIIGNELHTSKNNKQNIVEIADPLIPVIQKYRMSNLVYLFENRRRLPFAPHTISNEVKRIARRAGLNPKLNHKSLRKTFATYLYEEGVNIEDISKYLHHSSVAVTKKHYAKMLRRPFTGVTNKISDRLNRVV